MSITRHHNEWLSLVPHSGPFLSLSVLSQAFPQGLDVHDSEHARRLRMALGEWESNQSTKRPDTAIHRAWMKFVLAQTLGYDELLAEGQVIPQTLKSDIAEYGETLRPDWIVNDPATKKARLLVQVYPRSQSLTKPVLSSKCKTSPDTRMMLLLHDTGIRLGIITNGDHWMLVNAKKGDTTGYASWYSNLWFEEPITQRAFRTLLGSHRLFGVTPEDTLESLLDKSAADQQEVTDQLGYQVRKAVEVLVQALDKADQDHGGKLLANVDEKVLYESALTVMMRLVFLFCAEERGLLLLGYKLYDSNFAVSTLWEELRKEADLWSDGMLEFRHDAWSRMLTLFRVLFGGAKHQAITLPAYGGRLFDPDRFPFLEGRKAGTSWRKTPAEPLPINNRTVLNLLEALQLLQVKVPGGGPAETRKLSFRALDIEQIGHVYEGLLDHTAKRATEPLLGLHGTQDKEPEITLAQLEKIAAKGEKELLKFLKDESGRSESALKKGLNAELDDQLISRFRTACQSDDALWKRVKPFAGLVRLDTVGYPVVITSGSVFVTGGTDRRSSGTHYTPKSLTEPIVQYTLEPLVFVGPAEGLPKEQWKLRSAKELLALKICDMACGSGAFLVQACRYMAARLLEAWDAIQRGNPGTVRITPEGLPSSGLPGEMLIPDDPDERLTYALRIVAQRCLYGVDINPLAVEMAKLSLWLLTLAKDKPFEFLDHAIRCGDSLVGIHNLDQLNHFNLEGKPGQTRIITTAVQNRIQEAVALRRQIMEMQANSVEEVDAQDRLLQEANEKIDRLKYAADLLISAEFVPGSTADKRIARDDAAIKVAVHFNDSDLAAFRREVQKTLALQVTFHWPLEFPEVMIEKSGFDAFVGNPPFVGGSRITGVLGTAYRDYLVQYLANNKRGRADLSAYFFLRAYGLIHELGAFGLVATNTIAQGDTREVGLDRLLTDGGVILRANSSTSWPGDASLEVAHVWFRRGYWNGAYILNNELSEGITSYLVASSTVTGAPIRLKVNSRISFQGCVVIGMGFILTTNAARTLILKDSRNKDVLFPYLNGEDLNTNPDQSPSRWIIDFHDWSLERAGQYPDCLDIVSEKVKPERDKIKRNAYRERWWLFAEHQPGMYEATRLNSRILVCTMVSKYLNFAFVPKGWVYANKCCVFAYDDMVYFGLLQNSIHESWSREFCSTLESRLNYSPTDAFETFPFPSEFYGLSCIGERYYAMRQSIMKSSNQGFTKIYNRYHDASEANTDIQMLRKLHIELDIAATAAYGWADLDLGHDFHETKQGVRYTICEPARREVLARLLKLNYERYAEEVKAGLHEKKKPKAMKGKKMADSANNYRTLFGEDSK